MTCRYLQEWEESVPYGSTYVSRQMSECISDSEEATNNCDNCPCYEGDNDDGGIP